MSSKYSIGPVDLNEAVERITAGIDPIEGTEVTGLANATGRIAAEDVSALVSLPPFPSSAMDGYALRSEDIQGNPPYELKLVGQSLAGRPFDGSPGVGEAVRIFTGAAMPQGADTVVIQEDCTATGEGVRINTRPNAGDNVRCEGHDVGRGEIIVRRGQPLTPFSVGWLAASGHESIAVSARPRVAVFSTGDELQEPGSALGPGQIYESNRHMLRGLLQQLPVEVTDLGRVADDPDETIDALQRAATQADAMITTGGVSVGDADFVADAVESLGSLEVWRMNIKPGKPFAFGRVGSCLFFGLPGNPVSAAITYLMIARPALVRLCGAEAGEAPSALARLTDPISHKPGREEFQRGRMRVSGGETTVSVTGDQSSNRLATFDKANCLIRIPKQAGSLAPGATVEVLPLFGLI
ncbi:MAG TPA: gephyrin-like molybdotransferase Glp [Pseudomonadales bacterium]